MSDIVGPGLDEIGEAMHNLGPLLHGGGAPRFEADNGRRHRRVSGAGITPSDVGKVQVLPVER